MFPEGTRRKKGLRKKYEAAAHTGAARIALEAGVPLVPAGIKGTDGLRTLEPWRVRYGAPIELDDLREQEPPRRRARDRAADGRDPRARGVAVSGLLLAIDGDSLAHRAYHALPKSIRLQRARRLRELPAAALGGRAARRRCSSAGTRSRRRPTGTRRCPPTSRAASSRTSILEQLGAAARRSSSRSASRRQGGRLRGRRLPRRGRRARGPGRCSSRPPTATRSSSSPTASRSCSR